MSTTAAAVAAARIAVENTLARYAVALTSGADEAAISDAYLALEDARDALIRAARAAGAERALAEITAVADSQGRLAKLKDAAGVATTGPVTIRAVLRTIAAQVRAVLAEEDKTTHLPEES